jgi:hypothetical protein
MQNRKETKNSLYFKQYQYCVRLVVSEATALRGWNHDQIDCSISRRKSIGVNWGGSWRNKPGKTITPDVETKLHKVCDIVNSYSDQLKVMLTGNWFYAYTNNQTLINELTAISNDQTDTITEIELQGPKDSIILQQANHQYRSYFRNIRLANNVKENLDKFLQAQDSIRLSPALISFLDHNWVMCQDYYFIDHDDMSIISMLGILAPRVIRKTLPIVEHK